MYATLSRSARQSRLRLLFLPIMLFLGTASLLTAGPALADSYALKVAPASTNATNGQTMQVTVSAWDTITNKVMTGYTGTVALTSADGTPADTNDVLPANYKFTAADKGIHVFNVTLRTTNPAGDTDTITATDTAGNVSAGLTSPAINIGVGSITKLAIVAPTTLTAGTAATAFTVNALNAYGQVVTSGNDATDSIQLSSTDSAVAMPAAQHLAAGTYDFTTVKLNTAGAQTITATTLTANGATLTATAPITVAPGVATVLNVAAAGIGVNGQTIPVTVTALDPYGNVATAFTGPVTLATSEATDALNGSYTYVATNKGVHVFNVTLNNAGTAGQDTFTATSTVGSILGFSNALTIQVAAGNVTHLSIVPHSMSAFNAKAGTANSYDVSALNAYNQVVTGDTDVLRFSSSDSQAVGTAAPYTLVAGAKNISVTLKTVGAQTFTLQDTTNPAIVGSYKFTVTPAAVASFGVAVPSDVAINGQPIPVTVTALDANGLVATGYTGTVALTSPQPSVRLG